MRTALLAGLAIAVVVTGCHVGPNAQSYTVARTPYGARLALMVADERFEAELLAVRDSGLLVLRSNQLLLVPFRSIDDARSAGGAHVGVELRDGRRPTSDEMERLRIQSRYPQGVTPELERRLLEAYGQTSLIVAGFLEQARAGVERYQDRAAAIADGYRRIGPDFPGMGEHWVQAGLLFRNTFDPARPPVLEYARIGDTVRLVGVAYALPLLAGESPPDFPARHAWHDHVGTVASEVLLLGQVHSTHAGAEGARLVMLHAWIGLDNPSGVFESENWALPFVRAGLPVPSIAPSPAAGRAVSLVSGGDVFYANLLQAKGRPDSADSVAIRRIIDQCQRGVAGIIAERQGGALGADDLEQLGSQWEQLLAAIGAAVQPDVRERLSPILTPPQRTR
jgi:hypothetical protein